MYVYISVGIWLQDKNKGGNKLGTKTFALQGKDWQDRTGQDMWAGLDRPTPPSSDLQPVSLGAIRHSLVHRRVSSMNAIFFITHIIVPLSAFLIFVLARLVSRHRSSQVMDSHGYAVLITGCDSGFGHQLALRLDRKGFVVFAGCLSPEGAGAQSLVRQSSSNLKILKLDVTSDEDVHQAKRTVQDNLPEKGECGSSSF